MFFFFFCLNSVFGVLVGIFCVFFEKQVFLVCFFFVYFWCLFCLCVFSVVRCRLLVSNILD